jgi:hypothetical protein
MSQGLAHSQPSDEPCATRLDLAQAPSFEAAARTPVARTVGKPAADPTLSTRKLYAGDWAGFVAWCRVQQRAALPATDETLAAYLLAAAPTLSRGALGRRRAAIGAMHREASLPPPRLDAPSRKALRTVAKPSSGAAVLPPSPAVLQRAAVRCPRDLAGLRDRAVLLLVAAMRRPAEQRTSASQPDQDQPNAPTSVSSHPVIPRLSLLALAAEDVRFTESGMVLQLRTRTDGPVPDRTLAVLRAGAADLCPVRALEDWLRQSDTAFGPVFRKVDRWGNVEHAQLGPDAWHGILARRSGRTRPRSAGQRGA